MIGCLPTERGTRAFLPPEGVTTSVRTNFPSTKTKIKIHDGIVGAVILTSVVLGFLANPAWRTRLARRPADQRQPNTFRITPRAFLAPFQSLRSRAGYASSVRVRSV